MQNKEIDVTDTIEELKRNNTPAQFKKMRIEVGRTLTFNYEGSITSIQITKIEDGHYYAREIEMHEQSTVASHYHHKVDQNAEPPFCWDCDVPVTEPATLEGKRKYEARKERHLSDGTPIDEDDDDDEPELPALV